MVSLPSLPLLPPSLQGRGVGVLLWILSVPIFLFTLLPLLSSTGPGVSSLYILSAAWHTASSRGGGGGGGGGSTSMRIGYYGLCWVGDDRPPLCVTTTGPSRTAAGIADAAHWDDPNDRELATRGIQFALDLQRGVFVAFMTAGGLAWLASLALVSRLIIVVPTTGGRPGGEGPGRAWRVAAKVAAAAAALLMVASSWATGQTVRGMVVMDRYTAGEKRFFEAGHTLVGLQWVAALLACVFAVGVSHVANSATKEFVYSYSMGR